MKKNFESSKLENNSAEEEYQSLSGREKFERLLTLFGTASSRDNFIDLCRKYIAERRMSSHSGRNEPSEIKKVYSPPKRANFHNAIMDTLKRLATQTRKIDPITEKVLNEVASRETIAAIAEEWVSANEYGEEEDEDQKARKGTSSMSAFFHSRGED